ncbi:hypothetical protein KP509_02G006800 [Ceratopteris richardii]|uniref:Protein EARLY FLOWERING 4 domain-containing protein n=1 Tax=Ceratopteris richardii TaxID=49495 RepID=A0A8T2V6A1_CERRI|nr:hypothetical protein KP509_02G006800 [Ceratopteris richardii]
MEAGRAAVKSSREGKSVPKHEAIRPSWEAFSSGCCQVQKILEENKVLIGEINQNQESRTPENLTRNVSLIKELNDNVNHVAGIYSVLSSTFVKFMSVEVNKNPETNATQKVQPNAMLSQKRTRAS